MHETNACDWNPGRWSMLHGRLRAAKEIVVGINRESSLLILKDCKSSNEIHRFSLADLLLVRSCCEQCVWNNTSGNLPCMRWSSIYRYRDLENATLEHSPQSCTGKSLILSIGFAVRKKPSTWRIKRIFLKGATVASMNGESSTSNDNHDLYQTLTEFVLANESRPKSLLFFVNPLSGDGKALGIFKERVVPILQECEIRYEFVVSTHAGHARDLIRTDATVQNHDGIIAVGGDGIFNEVLEGALTTGLKDRMSFASQLNTPSWKVGIIPAGSTDSISHCIGSPDVETAMVHIILGRCIPLDVGAVYSATDGSFLRFFCAFLGYGFFSDTLRISEKPWMRRWLGKTRYMLAGATAFLLNRSYEGSVSFRNDLRDISDGYPDSGPSCIRDCSTCSLAGSSVFPDSQLDLHNDIPWETVKGKFSNVIAVSLSCRSSKSPKGLHPSSHCADGCLDLLLVRKIGRFRLLRYLVSTSRGIGPRQALGSALRTGRAYEFRFLAGSEDEESLRPSESTVWNCDGEIIREANIHAKIYCQLIRVFGGGLEL